MPTVKLSSKGQIAIPKAIRDGLGLKKDMVLEISVDRSLIILKPSAGNAWLALEGCLKGTRVLEDLEADHRNEVVPHLLRRFLCRRLGGPAWRPTGHR